MAPGPSPEKFRVEIIPLTSIRGVAALWVVALHLSVNLPLYLATRPPAELLARMFAGGYFAVDIFFLLSGYIMMETYGTAANSVAFFRNRLARIFPLHLVVASLVVFYILVIDNGGILKSTTKYMTMQDLPLYFTLTFVWFGILVPAVWNSPVWSLSAELAAYIIFPGLQYLLRHSSPRGILICLILLLGAQYLLLAITGFQSTGIIAVLRAIFGFAAGTMLCSTRNAHPLPAWLADFATAWLLVCSLLGQLPLAVFPAALLVAALRSPGDSLCHRVLTTAPAHWTGKISFSIYLVHIPVLFLGTLLLARLGGTHHPQDALVFVLIYLVALLAVSSLTYRFIEKPGRTFTRRLLLWCWRAIPASAAPHTQHR
jgi:peptidoglycan/LPS O-acetylase OafA/YrhL